MLIEELTGAIATNAFDEEKVSLMHGIFQILQQRSGAGLWSILLLLWAGQYSIDRPLLLDAGADSSEEHASLKLQHISQEMQLAERHRLAPLFLASLSPYASEHSSQLCTANSSLIALPIIIPWSEADDCLDGSCTLESTSILRHPAMILLRLLYSVWHAIPRHRQIVFALSSLVPTLDTVFTDLHAVLNVQKRTLSTISVHCLDMRLWQSWLQTT